MTKNQDIKQKQYCNKFNEDLKMVHIKKNLLKEIKVVFSVLVSSG